MPSRIESRRELKRGAFERGQAKPATRRFPGPLAAKRLRYLRSVDLTAIYLVALPAALYLRAVRVLARRGFHVPNSQQALWFAGLALLAIALLSPLDHLGETDLLSAHMAQHLLLGDLSAPLLVLGARWPVYAFLLPVPVMRPLARSHTVRSVIRTVTKPLVAGPIWIFS